MLDHGDHFLGAPRSSVSRVPTFAAAVPTLHIDECKVEQCLLGTLSIESIRIARSRMNCFAVNSCLHLQEEFLLEQQKLTRETIENDGCRDITTQGQLNECFPYGLLLWKEVDFSMSKCTRCY